MDAKLQQAVDSLRAGDKVEAQKTLVELVQENPDEVQGWYLLSLIVDSKEQQAAYAAKALALDPNHEKAQEHLAQLQTEPVLAATAVATEVPDLISQEQGDTLPDWMAGDEELVTATAVATAETPTDSAEEELPDWIQEPVSDSWIKSDEPAPAAETPAAKPAKETAVSSPKATKPQEKKKGVNRLDLILALLVIAVIIIVIYLFYLVTSS
ncbi:MAG TPA: hypothetical protein EYP41_11070 [Anaerolineae bacterium]|nr:hypothetical protein [Anaerolineae bacterium]HIP70150.1 hypothetical protein [Anaerolineae bacterium]